MLCSIEMQNICLYIEFYMLYKYSKRFRYSVYKLLGRIDFYCDYLVVIRIQLKNRL